MSKLERLVMCEAAAMRIDAIPGGFAVFSRIDIGHACAGFKLPDYIYEILTAKLCYAPSGKGFELAERDRLTLKAAYAMAKTLHASEGIDMDDACITALEVVQEFLLSDACPRCKGTTQVKMYEKRKEMMDCPECQGTGKVPRSKGSNSFDVLLAGLDEWESRVTAQITRKFKD